MNRSRRLLRPGSRWILALALCIVIAGSAAAQVSEEFHEARGTGASEREAIADALQNAAFQLCGVTIQSETSASVTVTVDDDGMKLVERINDRIRITTGKDDCRFSGYDLVGVTRAAASVRAHVRVRYSTLRIECRGPPVERRRLAVVDFAMDEVHLYGAGGDREQRSGGRVVRRGVAVDFELIRNLQERFRARIEELLTQGRRFAVLDRRSPEIYEQEKKLLESADVDPGEGARLGKVLGADYLLYGTVDRIEVTEEQKTIALTGESSTETHAAVRVRFSVLAVATRQVKWSSSLELLDELTDEIRPEQAAERLLDELALHIVDELTENIYPPVVTQVTGWGSFVVNRGGNTVRENDLFEVFALGDVLVDPDTGESLGRLERTAGIARITAVKPKFSLAEMVTEHDGIARGMILRRFHDFIGEQGGSEARPVQPRGEGERNYRRIDSDGGRAATTGDNDSDGSARLPEPRQPPAPVGVAAGQRTPAKAEGPARRLKPHATRRSALPRDGLDGFDPFVVGEAPDADVAAGQVAVAVPVQGHGRALVIDSTGGGEDTQRGGDPLRPGVDDRARPTAHGTELVANCGRHQCCRRPGPPGRERWPRRRVP